MQSACKSIIEEMVHQKDDDPEDNSANKGRNYVKFFIQEIFQYDKRDKIYY